MTEIEESVAWDRFGGEMLYQMQTNGNLIHSQYICDHWREMYMEFILAESVKEFGSVLKDVARACLPAFLEEYPKYRDACCLQFD